MNYVAATSWGIRHVRYRLGPLSEEFTSLCAWLVEFKVRDSKIEGAPQPALTRWAFLKGLRNIDPELISRGGQSHWDRAVSPMPPPRSRRPVPLPAPPGRSPTA